MFAAIELGLTLVTDIPHPYSHEDLLNYKISMHGQIDLAIVDRASQDSGNIWDIIVYYKICKNILFDYDFDTYLIQQPELYTARAARQVTDPEIGFWSIPTSGTTGKPQPNIRSHKFELAQIERLIRIANFTGQNSRALHICDLHHGISLHHHFIPAFSACESQYLLDNTDGNYIDNVTAAVYKNRISHVLLHTPDLLTEWVSKTPVIEWDLTVNTLFQIPKEMVQYVKEKQINRVISHFGSSTLGGPILIKIVTPETDIETYRINEFVPINDGYYLFELRDEELWTCIPSQNIDWQTGKDWFKFENGSYLFQGRSDIFCIKGVDVKFQVLDNLVMQHLGTNATASIDVEHERIYLALWSNVDPAGLVAEFAQLYPTLTIDYIIRNEPKQRFWNGRKVDRSAIRDYCREKLLHSATLIAYNT